ncbi:hypothetical protein [Neobacillus drentensis]|jgi:hypothetical protein|uniref:hypothetical protein n=1 Tax=Neobacillus drentensis TaxID=220684 RepID=UPI002FFFCCE4
MEMKDLEFRGINRKHLGMYFEELGATLVTDTFPYTYKAEEWSGQILAEEEIAFTSVFKVNSVQIRFIANNENELEELIKNYRYKTTRIGG